MPETCKSCKFWEVYEADATKQFKRGKCRRYPPVIDPIEVNEQLVFYKENGEEEPATDSACPTLWTQPPTFENCWCSEYTEAK